MYTKWEDRNHNKTDITVKLNIHFEYLTWKQQNLLLKINFCSD